MKSNVINLSRFDPQRLTIKSLKGAKSDKYRYICYDKQDSPALCVTVGVVMEDRSKELVRNAAGIGSKFVAATPLTYEYERWVATIAMVLGGRTFKSQITENKLVFSTRPDVKSASTKGRFSIKNPTSLALTTSSRYKNAHEPWKVSFDFIQA